MRPFYFVDLPGYGYAQVSQAERESWRSLIENYITKSTALAGAISIVDLRHGAVANDMELLTWLAAIKIPTVLVATKADKLSNKNRADMYRQVNAAVAPLPLQGTLMFSAEDGLGFQELWKQVLALLNSYKARENSPHEGGVARDPENDESEL